jgi:putative membrane protein
MTAARKSTWLWILGALAVPLVLIGTLLGAFSSAESGLERIPVALVNNDELITETDENGEETFFLASRPLVLELTGSEDIQVNWVITDQETALQMLDDGEVYAIFEIPDDFSLAVKSLETTSPRPATFTIRTNPAHSYLAGVAAEQIGTQVASALSEEFGREILNGLFTVILDLGDALDQAAEGAREIRDGVDELSDGVGDLRTGTDDLASGYREFDDGLGQYLDGVGELSDGLSTFERETRELPELAAGVRAYTDGVAQAVAGLNAQIAQLDAKSPDLSAQELITRGVLAQVVEGLSPLVSGGSTLSGQANTAIRGVREGIVQTADGAEQLADASGELRSGSADIRSGTGDLASGVAELDDGVAELADGVTEFADALTDGAEQFKEEAPADPTDETLTTLTRPVQSAFDSGANEAGFQQNVAVLVVPLGLWLSALVTFLLFPVPSARTLASTLSTTTLMRRQLGQAGGMALVQGAVALALLHTLGGVPLAAIGLTTTLVALGALGFTVLHYAVWAAAPRAVALVSLVALVAQLATIGVVLPAEILPAVYRALSGFGPVSWLADGLLAAAAGGSPGRILASSIGFALLIAVSLGLGRALLGRRRHRVVREHLLGGVGV